MVWVCQSILQQHKQTDVLQGVMNGHCNCMSKLNQWPLEKMYICSYICRLYVLGFMRNPPFCENATAYTQIYVTSIKIEINIQEPPVIKDKPLGMAWEQPLIQLKQNRILLIYMYIVGLVFKAGPSEDWSRK